MTINFQGLHFRAVAIILFCFWYLPSFGQKTTSPEVNKAKIIKYFNEVINTQKLSRLGEFFAQDYIWHQMNGVDVRSSEDSSHITMLKFIYTSIPDIHYTIEHVIVEEDMVAVNSTATGSAKSELFGLPAAVKKVHFKQMFFFRMKNNRIIEEWEVVDVDGLKAQLVK